MAKKTKPADATHDRSSDDDPTADATPRRRAPKRPTESAGQEGQTRQGEAGQRARRGREGPRRIRPSR